MRIVLKFSPVARRCGGREQRRLKKALCRETGSDITWAAMETALCAEKSEVSNRTPRVHSLPHYVSNYDAIVDRSRPVRMLEIGSYHGDSVQRWKACLHPDSLVVGIDPDSRMTKIADSSGVYVRFGGGQRTALLSELATAFGRFDIVIDVASQTTTRMTESFRLLFDSALTKDGIYIFEDVYCDIWTLYNSFSASDILTILRDALRGHYRIATSVAHFRAGHFVVVHRTLRSPVVSTGN
ncbi:hypothetical protein A5740_09455 [Mycobacterium sp. GA-1841]|uniref:hypothetical protein n=1 Tax=Mycobacterium sp. GA-1841 TaxID=1834154 RepID=UPI00096D866E|nr:hypothetical protein [Mycobacterium sp. GA-1841]OMC34680.1 hypothetical protein A5740_09455 [Mycobacterium sp. GA-1841]